MDTHKVKTLADEIEALARAESWLEEHGQFSLVDASRGLVLTLNFATGMRGHAEAQHVVAGIVKDLGEEILNAALAFCESRRRELTGTLRAEIGS